MITISDGKLTIPEGQRFIGFTGDNRHTQKKFFIRNNPESGWLYRLYLTFDDGSHNHFVLPATVSEEGTWLIWNIEEGHIFKSGLIKAQIKAFSGSNEVYHTTSDVFIAGKATEEDEEFKNTNSEFLLYEKTLNDLYTKMLSASARMPYVGTNGNWFTYDVSKGEYTDSGVNAYVPIAEGGITQELLDRVYWQKTDRVSVHNYDGLDDILKSENASSAVFRIEFSGLSPIRSVVGEGSFLGVTNLNCEKLLIINITNADRWIYDKESLRLRNVEVKSENISNGSIGPSKLDRSYWERVVESGSITSFDALFEKVKFTNTGGSIAQIAVNITTDTNGVINGLCLAYGKHFTTGDTVYIINNTKGEFWKVDRYVVEGNYQYVPAKLSGLAVGAVITEAIANGAVTSDKIADGAITYEKLAQDISGTIKLDEGAIDRELLFSNTMIAKYLSMPVSSASTSGTFYDDFYNYFTTQGIYQLSSQTGEKQTLIVFKPDSDYHLMQLRLSYNKIEYRGIYCTDAGKYPAEDWEAWVELGGTNADAELDLESDNPVQNKAVAEAINNINTVLDGLEELLSDI